MTWAYFPVSTLPAPYDLVWCRFPHHESLGEPGPKPRPALVRNVAVDDDSGHGHVEVVYGTTKLKLSSRLFDFVISKPYEMDHCGLYRATRFDLDKHVWVPWAAEWFEALPGTSSAVLGHLTDHSVKMLQITIALKQHNLKADD